MIKEANELEKVFGTESDYDDEKVEIPILNIVAFVNLPSLYQGVQFQAVHTVTTIPLFRKLDEVSEEGHDNGNENPSAEITKDFDVGIEVEAASEHEFTSSQEYTDGQIEVDLGDSQEANQTNNQVSLNDDDFMKENSNTEEGSSNIEEQFPEDDQILDSRSTASQFPSMPSKGDASETVEDLSSSFLVTRELEKLVSKKHLAIENLPLLTDFLVTHSYVLLKDTSLSNRYKGYAYNCLAELLKFLQTHSVLDVLGSSHSEFVELVQDARKFSFDKDWLDGVEKRTFFPGLQVSQDALQKLLDSKHMLTQHVEDLKHQLASS
ncbi:CC-NBS-LRR resistance protein, partial [Trifolium medium]|nr:CC-NBS-LRR resistance protein [Trifolium medium]